MRFSLLQAVFLSRLMLFREKKNEIKNNAMCCTFVTGSQLIKHEIRKMTRSAIYNDCNETMYTAAAKSEDKIKNTVQRIKNIDDKGLRTFAYTQNAYDIEQTFVDISFSTYDYFIRFVLLLFVLLLYFFFLSSSFFLYLFYILNFIFLSVSCDFHSFSFSFQIRL